MRALLPLFVCLMLVLASWAGVVHAAETAGGTVAGVAIVLHAPGDEDEVPGDADSALPHHHGMCHGHDLGAPAATLARAFAQVDAGMRRVGRANRLTGILGSVIPRPPQA